MPVTKREEATTQGFCKILGRTLRLRESLLLVLIQFQFQSLYHSSRWGGGGRLFGFDWEGEGLGWALFLPLGWALIRGGRLCEVGRLFE